MSKQRNTPTRAGVLRYPPNGLYLDATNFEWVCTCSLLCPAKCTGECGCEACITAWEDFEEFGGKDG